MTQSGTTKGLLTQGNSIPEKKKDIQEVNQELKNKTVLTGPGSHRTTSMLLMYGLMFGGLMSLDPADNFDFIPRRRSLPSIKKCKNPHCDKDAERGRTHCSADCYQQHYKLGRYKR